MSLKNKRILITCGPTWVPIDDVRVIGNQSTGELGQTLARQLAAKGAKVTLLEGPVHQPLSDPRVEIRKYTFFTELAALLKKTLTKNFAAVIHAAAVSDYQVNRAIKGKLPSGIKELTLTLKPLPKLINGIKRLAPGTLLVGFKLEKTTLPAGLFKKARRLFQDAGCDLVVANSFTDGYQAYLFSADGHILAQARSRLELANKIVTQIKDRI